MAIDIPFATGGGERAPTSLDFQVVFSSNSHASDAQQVFGAQRTATITSATLTEVLNISNGTGGYFTYAALLNPSVATVTNPKIRIVIDGQATPALDASSGTTILTNQHLPIVGLFNDSGENMSTESIIHFKKSFVVSIAGDGTDGVQFGFKRVLT